MITVAPFGDQKLNICVFLLPGKSSTTEKCLQNENAYFGKKRSL